jgi:hypothetical protein
MRPDAEGSSRTFTCVVVLPAIGVGVTVTTAVPAGCVALGSPMLGIVAVTKAALGKGLALSGAGAQLTTRAATNPRMILIVVTRQL